MSGVNKLYTEIVKTIFKANNGKQMQLLRQKNEVMDFIASGETANDTQQAYIDAVLAEYKLYDDLINAKLGTTPLKDMVDE